MPEFVAFYGIIIRMFVEPSERHHTPRFHAYYGEHVAVEAWAELHHDELQVNWNLSIERRPANRIAPLQ